MILVALGSNLPFHGLPPRAVCEAALAALERMAVDGVALGPARRSAWIASAPMPAGAGGDDYVNGVARFDPPGGAMPDPAALLRLLHAVEARFGRSRSVPNAARTLDLDLIAMGGLVRHDADPLLPHPRAHLRRFVLEPLRDVAPDWVHPVTGAGIAAMLAALPEGGTRPLPAAGGAADAPRLAPGRSG